MTEAIETNTDEQQKVNLEATEIELLTEGIYQHYGFDFRHYSLPSLRRRIWKRIYAEGLSTISGLQEKVLHDPACMEQLLLDLSINTTAMFRDPTFYLAFRQKIVPALRTYPFVRIWHAGCSSGEEVYSMAIILKEEGLYWFEALLDGEFLTRMPLRLIYQRAGQGTTSR